MQPVAWLQEDGRMEQNGMGCTLPKTNMDTQNAGLAKVSPFKNGNFWYPC